MLYALIASRNGETLDARTAFSSTALLALVTHPANMIMTIIPRAVAAQVGFRRVQSFLHENDPPDTRVISHYGSRVQQTVHDTAIRLENATIRFALSLPPVFEEVDLHIKRGCVTACLGSTGSGKTALVRALLGDLVISSGTLEISQPRIAVCLQTPWLPNGSVREAICGMSPHRHDSDWYDTVVRACCLELDFKALPESDGTQIGYCGVKLSGGQRQRVVSWISDVPLPLLTDP